MKKLTFRGDGKLLEEIEVTIYPNPTNTQEDKLSVRQLIVNCFNGDNHIPVSAINNLEALISTQREQAQRELLDELEDRVANPNADQMTMEDFRGRADMVARGTYNFINSKRATLKGDKK